MRSKFFYRDLIEVVEAAGQYIDVVVIPKCYGPEDILFVDRFLSQIEENMNFEPGRIRLEVLIESADAVLHAEQIAKCSPRVGGLIFGLMDYAGDIGAQELGAEQFFYYNYAKAKTIAAARAAGITVVDGVTPAVRDLDALAARYRELGFTVGARNHHPWGTANHIVQLPGFFIELLTVEDPRLLDAQIGRDGMAEHFGRPTRDAIARRTAGGIGASFPKIERQRISLSSKSSILSYSSKSIFIDRSAP